jgi:hypothetical protein
MKPESHVLPFVDANTVALVKTVNLGDTDNFGENPALTTIINNLPPLAIIVAVRHQDRAASRASILHELQSRLWAEDSPCCQLQSTRVTWTVYGRTQQSTHPFNNKCPDTTGWDWISVSKYYTSNLCLWCSADSAKFFKTLHSGIGAAVGDDLRDLSR